MINRFPKITCLVLVLGLALVGAACTADAPEVTGGRGPITTPRAQAADATSPADQGPTSSTVPPASRFDAPGPLMGVAVTRGKLADVQRVENRAGVGVNLVRFFARWDTDLSSTDLPELLAGGRRINLSVRPNLINGEVIPWSDIAEAEVGSELYQQMEGWADAAASLGPGSYFTFNHEPDTRDSAPNGDAEAFVAAWRRMAELVRERAGSDVRLVWTVTSGLLERPERDRWYPGDDVVDVIGADSYNWFKCQGTDREWESLEDMLGPSLEFAARRNKPLALPEFASASDSSDSGRRAVWIDDAVDTLLSEPARSQIEFIAWFNMTAPGGEYPECIWDVDADPASEAAFANMVRRLVGAD